MNNNVDRLGASGVYLSLRKFNKVAVSLCPKDKNDYGAIATSYLDKCMARVNSGKKLGYFHDFQFLVFVN